MISTLAVVAALPGREGPYCPLAQADSMLGACRRALRAGLVAFALTTLLAAGAMIATRTAGIVAVALPPPILGFGGKRDELGDGGR